MNDAFEGLDVAFCPDILRHGTDGLCKDIASIVFRQNNSQFAEVLAERYRMMKECFQLRLTGLSGAKLEELKKNYSFGKGSKLLSRPSDVRLSIDVETLDRSDGCLKKVWGKCNFGHDLPVWIVPRGIFRKSVKKVMIIAQDPLRAGQKAGFLTLSSPFGIHSRDIRECSGSSRGVVIELVAQLLQGGYAVYITDGRKLYAGEEPINGDMILQGRFIQMLKREADEFSPDVILLMGAETTRMLIPAYGRKAGFSNEVIPYPDVKSYRFKGIPCCIGVHPRRLTSYRKHFLKENGEGNADLASKLKSGHNSIYSYLDYYIGEHGLPMAIAQTNVRETWCDICGKVGETAFVNGTYVCSECMDEETYRCEKCKKRYTFRFDKELSCTGDGYLCAQCRRECDEAEGRVSSFDNPEEFCEFIRERQKKTKGEK